MFSFFLSSESILSFPTENSDNFLLSFSSKFVINAYFSTLYQLRGLQPRKEYVTSPNMQQINIKIGMLW